MNLTEVIKRLRYKAENIKAKLEPSYFSECADYLEKYRWHDLRKNPEDLPTEDGYYDVLVQYADEIWTMTARYETKNLITGSPKGFGFRADRYKVDFCDDSVIDWKEREIEPFEEVSE